MVNLFRSVFDETMFLDVHYVDSNPAVVRTVNVTKVDGELQTEEVTETYNLNCLAEEDKEFDLMHNFFVKLNFQWHPVHVKYFNTGILSKLFGRRNPKRIFDLVSNSDWAIVSEEVYDEITKTDEFRPNTSKQTKIGYVGDIIGTQIYLVPEIIKETHNVNGIIYTGNRRTITPVIHRNEDLYVFHFNEHTDVKKYILT